MFSKRFNFLTVAGIHIGIDLSWFFIAILLSWTLAAGYFPFTYPGQALSTYWIMGVIGMLGLFICILLHELGHAFVAKYFKLPISQITLFLFGGVAEIKKEATSPKVEFLVAIGGPVVTLLLIILLSLFTHFGVIFHVGIPVLAITSYLAAINTFILLFNLIPALPMDGGRVLRALLAMKLGRANGTFIAGGADGTILQSSALGFTPMAPNLSSPKWFPEDGFKFVITGQPNAYYQIEVSSNGALWDALTNVWSATAVLPFRDALAPREGKRFYRAVPQ